MEQNIEKNNEEIFVVDRIEDEYAVCENRKTKEMIDILVNELPNNIHEGSIIKKINGVYEICNEEEKQIEERIKEKMNRLFKK